MANYLHKILVEIPTVYTLSAMSAITPVHALSVSSIHLSDNKHQEIQDQFPSMNFGRKTHPKLQQKSLMTLP